MLSRLKRKSEADASLAMPAWHPNFRNYEKLPDVKVIRTAFFINGAAIFIALGLAVYFGLQQWQLRSLNNQIAANDRIIARDKKISEQAVAQFKKFQAEEAKINEADAFVTSKPVVSDLLLHLAQTLPANVALDTFDLRETGLVLRLTVRGALERATGYANAYRDQLAADKELGLFENAEITNLSPNPATGRLAVELLLKTKAAVAKK
jgi:hypothetical protein